MGHSDDSLVILLVEQTLIAKFRATKMQKAGQKKITLYYIRTGVAETLQYYLT
jgi:hypothetical protein